MTSSERLAQTRRKPPFMGVVRQLSQLRARVPVVVGQRCDRSVSRAATTPPGGTRRTPPAPPKRARVGNLSPARGVFKNSGRVSPSIILIADTGREPLTGFTGSGE